ncbi:MAG: methyltransferase domain-containing protein [bacterium]|nr:methyltransferase domain-containing protein [bacterium]
MIEKVYFQDIDIDGACFGYLGDKRVKAYGVLPGEVAKVKIINKKKEFFEAIPIEVIESSPYRIDSVEEHFISCSPWQVMDYSYQLRLKKQILRNIFGVEDLILEPSPKIFGYRTKVEFSFFIDQKVNLAFFKRGTYKSKYKLSSGCVLASERMNNFAIKIVELINRSSYDFSLLKGFVIRESKSYNDLVGSLFVKSEEIELNVDLEKNEGFYVFYSDPRSPAFVFTKQINHKGIDKLAEDINGLKIFYGIKSFFQNNVYLFKKAIKDMKFEIDQVKKIIELYCGVGTIGLSFTDLAKEIIGIEIIEEACQFARLNAEVNNIKNYTIINADVVDIDRDLLEGADILVIDPPRTGLNPKVIKKILDCLPNIILYLSCNPLTQKRDCEFLSDRYAIDFIKAYDFYPHTPHIECLVKLIKKGS